MLIAWNNPQLTLCNSCLVNPDLGWTQHSLLASRAYSKQSIVGQRTHTSTSNQVRFKLITSNFKKAFNTPSIPAQGSPVGLFPLLSEMTFPHSPQAPPNPSLQLSLEILSSYLAVRWAIIRQRRSLTIKSGHLPSSLSPSWDNEGSTLIFASSDLWFSGDCSLTSASSPSPLAHSQQFINFL